MTDIARPSAWVWVEHYATAARQYAELRDRAIADMAAEGFNHEDIAQAAGLAPERQDGAASDAVLFRRDDVMRYGEVADYLRHEEREGLTSLALSLSLCPIHFCDYAICFDDEPAECGPVRIIHPLHDT